MPRYELNGKVALVTGAARGIGFATAQSLIARGASAVVVDLDEGAARRLESDADPHPRHRRGRYDLEPLRELVAWRDRMNA